MAPPSSKRDADGASEDRDALSAADAEFLDAMGRLDVDSGAFQVSSERSATPDPSRRTSGRHRPVTAGGGSAAEPDLPSTAGVRPGHELPDEPASRRRKRRRGRSAPSTVEARLDLHGDSVEEALDRLDRFLIESAARGHRRVLVITGRGRRSPGGEPVVRKAVLQWLRRSARGAVREILPAPPELGGAGALVLMLPWS